MKKISLRSQSHTNLLAQPCIKSEETLHDLINELRNKPLSLEQKLTAKLLELERLQLKSPLPKKELEKLQEDIKVLSRALEFISKIDRNHGKAEIQQSSGLCLAARDFVCNIGAVGLLAPVSEKTELREKGIPSEAATRNYIQKYGTIRSNAIIYENFCYGTLDPLLSLAKIIGSTECDLTGSPLNLLRENVRVMGCAIGVHKGLSHVVSLIFMDIFFERDIVSPLRERKLVKSPRRLRPAPALFTPSSSNVMDDSQYISKHKWRAGKKFAKLLISQKISIQKVLNSLQSTSKTINYLQMKNYFSSMRMLNKDECEFLIKYFLDNNSTISQADFFQRCKKIILREVKAAEINKTLLRIKSNFTSRQILVDDIYHILAKDQDFLTPSRLLESLNELRLPLSYEEFQIILLAFEEQNGHFDPYNFAYVLRKVKPSICLAGEKKSDCDEKPVEKEGIPIVISPKTKSSVTCISLNNYLLSSHQGVVHSRPTSTSIVTNNPSIYSPRPTPKSVTDALISERLNLYSKKVV